MNVKIRRLYDIVNILEGAGVVQCIPGNSSTVRSAYQWIAPGYFPQDFSSDPMEDDCEEEEEFLDSWIKSLQAQSRQAHIASKDLMKVFGEDSTVLAMVNPHACHVTEYQDLQRDRFSVTLGTSPPSAQRRHEDSRKVIPQAYVLDNTKSTMHPVVFPSTIVPVDKENVPQSFTLDSNISSAIRDYSPLKKLLSVIACGDKGGGQYADEEGDSFSRLVNTVSTEGRTSSVLEYGSQGASKSRHPFETLLEASALRESGNTANIMH